MKQVTTFSILYNLNFKLLMNSLDKFSLVTFLLPCTQIDHEILQGAAAKFYDCTIS